MPDARILRDHANEQGEPTKRFHPDARVPTRPPDVPTGAFSLEGYQPTCVTTCNYKGLRSDEPQRAAPGAAPEPQPDRDLQALIAAWATLPAAIRAAIMGLATYASPQGRGL